MTRGGIYGEIQPEVKGNPGPGGTPESSGYISQYILASVIIII
jgi:hypothetical protein